MSTDKEFIEYIADQAGGTGHFAYRKMFGEYALYVDGKVVALVCDNRLFVKPTEPGRTFLGVPVMGAPYPGAKEYFAVDSELDDAERLAQLLRLTADALPASKPKRVRGATTTRSRKRTHQ